MLGLFCAASWIQGVAENVAGGDWSVNYVKGPLPVHPKADKPELSSSTRAQVIAYLRGYFDALVRGGALPSNSGAYVKIPIGRSPPMLSVMSRPRDGPGSLLNTCAHALSYCNALGRGATDGFPCQVARRSCRVICIINITDPVHLNR